MPACGDVSAAVSLIHCSLWCQVLLKHMKYIICLWTSYLLKYEWLYLHAEQSTAWLHLKRIWIFHHLHEDDCCFLFYCFKHFIHIIIVFVHPAGVLTMAVEECSIVAFRNPWFFAESKHGWKSLYKREEF